VFPVSFKPQPMQIEMIQHRPWERKPPISPPKQKGFTCIQTPSCYIDLGITDETAP